MKPKPESSLPAKGVRLSDRSGWRNTDLTTLIAEMTQAQRDRILRRLPLWSRERKAE